MKLEDGFYKIDSEIWGASFWKTIYYIIFTYEVNNESVMEMIYYFFYSLGGLLPCPDCQQHYQQYFQKNDIQKVIHDKKLLWKWVYQLQREIFIRETKSNVAWTFDEWKKKALEMIQIDENKL